MKYVFDFSKTAKLQKDFTNEFAEYFSNVRYSLKNLLEFQLKYIPLSETHHPQLRMIINETRDVILLDYISKVLNGFKYVKQGNDFIKEFNLAGYFTRTINKKWVYYEEVVKFVFEDNKIVLGKDEVQEFLDLHNSYLWNGSVFHKDDDPLCSTNLHSDPVPLSCLLSHYTVCDEHNIIHSISEECPTCKRMAKDLILPYTYKVEDNFSSVHDKTILMGIELELEGATPLNILRVNKAINGHAVMKRDGSLNYGMEIVSRPASISIQKKEFESLFDTLPSLSLKADVTCGMHIHIDKKSLSQLQVGKINSFIYTNPKFVHKIARRQDNRFTNIDTDRSVTYGIVFDETEPSFYKSLKRAGGGKYQAINLDKPETIEFRMFASTTDKTTFYMNMEFVQALVDYTKTGATPYTIKENDVVDNFKVFVTNNKKVYPNLHKEMN